tara:strand:+ start:276 stop:458 length:183 start_codon:yes stop_codon:yes gene_type:complete
MQVGDKVIMMYYGVTPDDTEYTILEIEEKFIKVKHPEIGGYFHFSKSRVAKVIPSDPKKK